MKKTLYRLAPVVLLALSGATLAQKAADSKPEPKPEPKNDKTADPKTAGAKATAKNDKPVGDVIMRSNSGVHDDKKGIAKLTGNVRVTQEGEDFILYSDSATYDRNLNQAVATGNLKVETRDSTITGLTLRANFDTKHIVITGNVVMHSHGKDDGIKGTLQNRPNRPDEGIGDISHKPSDMTCDVIDFNYDIRQAVITGNIKLKQGKSTGTCKTITFDEEENIAELKDGVTFTDSNGQTFKCDTLTSWFDDDKVQVEGAFELISPRKKENDGGAGKPETPREQRRVFPKSPDIENELAKDQPPKTAPNKEPAPKEPTKPSP